MSTPVTQYTSPAALARRNALRGVAQPVLTDMIAKVSGIMDGFFRDRYVLPFTRVGVDVMAMCEDICTWRIINEIVGVNPNAGLGDEGLKTAHDDAMKWLGKVANPTSGISPDVDDSSSGPTASAPPAPRPRVSSQAGRGMIGVGLSGTPSTNGRRGGQFPGWPDGSSS